MHSGAGGAKRRPHAKPLHRPSASVGVLRPPCPPGARWSGSKLGEDQSALAPENFTTSAHFAVSSAIILVKFVDGPVSGTPPSSLKRCFKRASAIAALISALSLSATSRGVSLGAPIPYHPLAS